MASSCVTRTAVSFARASKYHIYPLGINHMVLLPPMSLSLLNSFAASNQNLIRFMNVAAHFLVKKFVQEHDLGSSKRTRSQLACMQLEVKSGLFQTWDKAKRWTIPWAIQDSLS